jgi:hypothetical protein
MILSILIKYNFFFFFLLEGMFDDSDEDEKPAKKAE